MKLATIDVGTNTTLMLVAEAQGADVRVISDRAEITRLGRGIGRDGKLGAEGIAATLAVLREYADEARGAQAMIAAVGTEALRRAPNAAAFLDSAASILGVPVEVIDGEREAALTFLATARSFPRQAAGMMIAVDIGGGSTEVVVSKGGQTQARHSLPLGSVRLTERHVRNDPPSDREVEAMTAEIRDALGAVPWPTSTEAVLVGTAGTVTTLAAMAQALVSYDPARVHGFSLDCGTLASQVERLRAATQAEREHMAGLDPRRADVILAGACILLETARRAGASQVIVSDRGIRWGLLYERLSET